MKKFLMMVGIAFCFSAVAGAQSALEENLKRHIYTLADDSLMGRRAGSQGARMAADYIVKQFKTMGLQPWHAEGYAQPFAKNGINYKNLIGVIPGSDPVLKDEYIVLGAHYDHLGMKGGKNNWKVNDMTDMLFDNEMAFDDTLHMEPGEEDVIYNGADDNASGSATLIELARYFMQHRSALKRSLLVVAFDAEEKGLYGSTYFSRYPVVPMEQIKLMMSIDMVGYLRTSGYLEYQGAGTIRQGYGMLNAVPLKAPNMELKIKKFENSVMTATDTRGFAEKHIPTLAVTTGTKSPYHKVTDEADGIDYPGLVAVTNHIAGFVELCATDPDFAASGEVAQIHYSELDKKGSTVKTALSVGLGNNHFRYDSSPFNGRSGYAYSLGLMGRYQMTNLLSLQLEAMATYDKTPYGTTIAENYTFHSVHATVPVQLRLDVINMGSSFRFFVGGGAYYRRNLWGKYSGPSDYDFWTQPEEWGGVFSIGMQVGSLELLGINYYGGTDALKDASPISAQKEISQFVIRYYFNR